MNIGSEYGEGGSADEAGDSLRQFNGLISAVGPTAIAAMMSPREDIRHGKTTKAVVSYPPTHLTLTSKDVVFRHLSLSGRLTHEQALGALVHFIDQELGINPGYTL